MRRGTRVFAAILTTVLLTIGLLTGCGSSVPTDKDAKAYVQAMLDLMCTGDYDHSVKLIDVEEGKETETRDKLIDDMLNELGEEEGLSDEVKAQFKDYMINAFSKCKYTVGSAQKAGDGEYDVTVTIEPLKLFDGVSQEFQEVFTAVVYERSEEISSMSEQELNDLIMTTLIGILNQKLETPTYADPEEVVVRYGLLDEKEKVYGCTETDGEKIGEKLFSLEGLE